jgi:NitT/TauT family transport system permease protein
MKRFERAHSRHRKWVYPLLVGICLIALWQLVATLNIWDPSIVPSPTGTLSALWEFGGDLIWDSLFTLAEVVSGFFVTVVVALFVATVLHVCPDLSEGVYGYIVILQNVPLFAIAPILFLWTGPGFCTRLIIIVLVAFFPVLVNTMDGLRRIDRELLDLFDSMKATRTQKLLRLEMPSALHMVLAGSKITLTMCVIGAVLAEMLVGDMIGLGYRIKQANAHFNVNEVFAALALLSVTGIGLFLLFTWLARRVLPLTEEEEA